MHHRRVPDEGSAAMVTATSTRTRGIRRRLPVGKVDGGSAALRLAIHSWSSRVNHRRIPDEGSGNGERPRVPGHAGSAAGCGAEVRWRICS
ncbi:hypothetical protein [Paenibacillus elgii]|uniref:hypothetical protein n=1 Tax=Paenibacillus elgii TaxID=189691 RepID=UPI0013D4C8E7|nr:hypothetical protein [Paenibacillus elgii]